MKKTLFVTFIVLALALTACGGTSDAQDAATTDLQSGELSLQMQLTIGTFKLEETDLAVDAQQASELLPLWQVLRDLEGSGTSAPEEIEAVLNQINDAMTPDQLNAIAAMNLTREDIFTLSQELGLTNGQPDSNMAGGGPGRGNGSGIPGVGGGGGTGAEGLTPEQIATAQAEREASGGGNRAALGLLDALIDLLESK
ncbi:MAG: hypothetical protein GXP40_01980 [Chloroflexi bacterium]|nr:hypothetical protein [Chloroflexota bacterium]